jgi:hypothetical protein
MPRMAMPPYNYPSPPPAPQLTQESCRQSSVMLRTFLRMIAGCLLLYVASAAAQYRSDTVPDGKVATEDFLSHGRGVKYEAFTSGTPAATLILLHGASGPGALGYRRQAEFFASRGYRTLLLHYYDATGNKAINAQNYAALGGRSARPSRNVAAGQPE